MNKRIKKQTFKYSTYVFLIMVLILDSISEHVTQAGRKKRSFRREKIRFVIYFV